jgi:multiple sugar transport system permease protein
MFMDGVPISLEEAAWVDGASNMQALRRIVLPLMWPGIAVVGIFTFFGQYGEPNYGQLAAYSLIYTMPVLLLYLLLSRKLGGAIKG